MQNWFVRLCRLKMLTALVYIMYFYMQMDMIICETHWLFFTDGWNHLHLYICWVHPCADGHIHLHLYMFGVKLYADGCGHMHKLKVSLCRQMKSYALVIYVLLLSLQMDNVICRPYMLYYADEKWHMHFNL